MGASLLLVRVKGKQGEKSPGGCFRRRARARQEAAGTGLRLVPAATMLASRRGTETLPFRFSPTPAPTEEGAPSGAPSSVGAG